MARVKKDELKIVSPEEKLAEEVIENEEPILTTNTPLIFARMADIMHDVEAIVKTKQSDSVRYKFRSIEDVMNALHPILVKHGVFVVPNVLKAESQRFTTSNNKDAYHSQVNCLYTFYTVDGSFVEASFASESVDYSDKATQQALSYCYKGVLLQTFCIPTEDLQNDGDGKQPNINAGKQQPKPAPAPQSQPQLSAVPPTTPPQATPVPESAPVPQSPSPTPVADEAMTEKQWGKLKEKMSFAQFADERDYNFWLVNTLTAHGLKPPERWEDLPYSAGKILFQVAKDCARRGVVDYTVQANAPSK